MTAEEAKEYGMIDTVLKRKKYKFKLKKALCCNSLYGKEPFKKKEIIMANR